jgi:hypothetical protein
MKVLKLIESPPENPVFGYVIWTDPERDGAIHIEDVIPANEEYLPTLFEDRFVGNPRIVNDQFEKQSLRWEFVNVDISITGNTVRIIEPTEHETRAAAYENKRVPTAYEVEIWKDAIAWYKRKVGR